MKTGQTLALLYGRVSSIKQTKVGDGLKSQETRCREFARSKGYAVHDEVFTDDVSGSRVDRPGMMKMLSVAKKQKSEVVIIIDDVSRLARGLQAHLELRGLIAKAGARLESPTVEFGDDSDAMLVEHLLASVSQHARQKNGEQTKNRMKARLQNGYFVFQAPAGYRYQSVSGRGKMLVRDEPVAAIVQEALEGYAMRRFETQADVLRYLQANPLFPHDGAGAIMNMRVTRLLTNPVYAGFVEAPNWGVTRRIGQHEPLVSVQTFQRVQDRLNDGAYANRQRNLNDDFPLRGFVVCAECENPLTACWSSGMYAKYAYYHCCKRGCSHYGKSIRREKIEGAFEAMLQTVQPTEKLFTVAQSMFRELWDHRLGQTKVQAKALSSELVKIDKQVAQFLDRIVGTSVPAVISAYENQIEKLEQEKALIQERIADMGKPKSTFDDSVRIAMAFLASPWNLWRSGRLEDRKMVLKLAFTERLKYDRIEGLRTANLSLPFKVLGQIFGEKKGMAHPKRFELLTPRFVVWCSIQLSYGCVGKQCVTACVAIL